MNDTHYRWYNDLTTGLTIFPDQERRSLESLLFEYAHGEEGDECLDEPYGGAGYCVCPVCQVLAPIAAELERQYQRLTAENAHQRTALQATWEALDGLYGANRGEVIPIELLPEDRRQLFHKALELVGAALDGREEAK